MTAHQDGGPFTFSLTDSPKVAHFSAVRFELDGPTVLGAQAEDGSVHYLQFERAQWIALASLIIRSEARDAAA